MRTDSTTASLSMTSVFAKIFHGRISRGCRYFMKCKLWGKMFSRVGQITHHLSGETDHCLVRWLKRRDSRWMRPAGVPTPTKHWHCRWAEAWDAGVTDLGLHTAWIVIYIYIYIYTYMYIHTYHYIWYIAYFILYIDICIYVYIYIYVHIHTCVYIYIYIHIYTYIHIDSMCIYIYIYIDRYITYTCVYIYIYTYIRMYRERERYMYIYNGLHVILCYIIV